MISHPSDSSETGTQTRPYSRPAIIYQGQISSRAGSPVGPIAPTDIQDVDPIDLFDEQSDN